ncbi:hypothetical protein [Streptomyces griseocarneus]|uniref:hypothetical protein n=1 Tax=Streptomyces griseocarneus TaxID=51201 RepID=UPI00167DE5AA|nr:hypothetical protein [Streptomyces griseocarneus]MBZ6477556.1 hypothetical protein [Streptomyces griseocarneus]GHG82519.1 hypothetical protein GCM10018779_65240 [Streptomyces griseocarneus]
MSKRQKGRRHRRVNRTPRPVGASRPATARAEPKRDVRQERPEAVPAPALGRHEARTWDGLRAFGTDGASLDELCASVGYQPRTIAKHVTGLAGHGLAELRGERWYAREAEESLVSR